MYLNTMFNELNIEIRRLLIAMERTSCHVKRVHVILSILFECLTTTIAVILASPFLLAHKVINKVVSIGGVFYGNTD
jgi:hypothetical protein